MGLRLLGPVEMTIGDRSVNLGGARQRTVLAVLGLNANRVVPVDQLIDAVWGADPPTTARSQIQICISALRRIFQEIGHPEAIDTRPPGYLLQLAPEHVDSLQFAAQLADARRQADAGAKAEASATLTAALALWRGAALSGISSDQVQRAATVLEDQRLTAVEERIQLDLELGRHQEVILELRALVVEQPMRERLHAYLMLALYRCGRQADALAAARRAREILAEELGLDPGAELQHLERAILQRDPSLGPTDEASPAAAPPAPRWTPPQPRQPTPVLPRQLPASITDFVGRDDQLDQIRQVLGRSPDDDRDHRGMPVVVISGMDGVGKSSLAIRAAHELGEHYPDGQLYADMHTWDGQDRSAELLARFLRALGVTGSAIPDGVDERGELYRSMLSGKRMLVVLDDVPPDVPVLPLLPGSSSCGVIIASRLRLTGLPGVRQIDLDVFDLQQSLQMLTGMVGRDRILADRADAAELADLCGGLPLALRITGARLASRPHWRLGGLVHRLRDEAKRLDEFTHHGLELRSSIRLAYRALDGRAQRLFRLCSLLRAPDFPGWTAAALLDCSTDEAEEILESLVDARLVDIVQYPYTSVRYRLHDLIRVYAAEKLGEEETDQDSAAALARVLGGWLALAEAAHQIDYGGNYTTLHGGAQRWTMPREEAARQIGDPADWWEAERRALAVAVRQAAEAGLSELCWDLSLTMISLFESKGYFDDWRECTSLAYQAAERDGNRIGMAAMRYSLGTLYLFQSRLAEADDCFATALEMFRAEGLEHGCALVLRNAAHIDGLRGDVASMLGKYTASLDIMRRVGDRIGEAHIMRNLAKHRMDEGDYQGATELLDQALVICEQTGCLRVQAQVLHRFAEVHLATGRLDLAKPCLHQVLRIVRDTGDRIGETHALYSLGLLRHREGRSDDAEVIIAHTLERARSLGERLVEARCRFSLGEIALATGRPEAGAAHLWEAAELFGRLGSTFWQERANLLLAKADQLAPPVAEGVAAWAGLAGNRPV
ncbi:AfsR/SARP family transcriptional regulator [Catellatospora chokoriensis]|uniref:SARP family transcriptional regulator n=1 Tax=Catellatospora chokoriensis TaxID=310353 RepID=A0A8J3K3X8_9ACTN|nr:AfsR/SARP family transcriptional regulator [Catellatospora chokoriensis]GIF90255.1 SARP family transcriptional regulator [Catellatospora chokoriensis]